MSDSGNQHAARRRTRDHSKAEGGYQLVDFGDGRKLERFGGRLLDRPSPAAEGARKRAPERWRAADSFFSGQQRRWDHRTPWPDDCVVDCGPFRMPIAPTPFGHVGVFPEQADNWAWLQRTGQAGALPKGLNLFAYTGASTLAMACSGMQVAHVDAAKPNVTSARQAARINALENHPIRYLVDDASKFVAREIRRGNRYHTVVMDPPAYGHSPSGKAWRLERDLWPLLDDCLRLLDPAAFRLLITGHSPQVRSGDVVDYLTERLRKGLPGAAGLEVRGAELARCFQQGRLTLMDRHQRELDAGFFVRFAFPLPTV